MPRVLILLLFIFKVSTSYTQPIITLTKTKTDYLGTHLAILKDPEGTLTIEDVILLRDKFKLSNEKVPQEAPTKTVFWVHFFIKNSTDNIFFLEVGNPTIDKLEIYNPVGDTIIRIAETGDLIPFSQRIIKRNNFVFPIDLPRGEIKEFYIRYTSSEQTEIPLTLRTVQELIKHYFFLDILHGIFYGVLIASILYNFFIYLVIKDKSYIYYMAFITFFGLLQAKLLGHTSAFIFPENSVLDSMFAFITGPLASIFFILFCFEFLQSKITVPRLHFLGYIFIFIFGVSFFLAFFNQLASNYLTTIAAILVPPYAIIMAVIALSKGYRQARFFLIASSSNLIAVSIFLIMSLGLLPYTTLTSNIIEIGIVAEAILFYLALGDRYTILRKEKKIVQKQLNDELKLKIKERMIAQENLQKINKDLLQTNSDLDSFIYAASHTIKGPVASMEGLINILELKLYKKEELNGIINMMKSSVVKLKNIVVDLTEISRVQKLTLKEDIVLNNVIEVIKDVEEDLFDHIEKSKARISIQLKDPFYIRFSEVNFKRIIYNILNNSIKFRSTFRLPQIVISVSETDEFNVLAVSDNGIGISKEYQSKVFSMFKKGEDYPDGRGIGLYVVKRIMETGGGKVELESTKGVGTTVKLYFRK